MHKAEDGNNDLRLFAIGFLTHFPHKTSNAEMVDTVEGAVDTVEEAVEALMEEAETLMEAVEVATAAVAASLTQAWDLI
jgi:hypothetical protein